MEKRFTMDEALEHTNQTGHNKWMQTVDDFARCFVCELDEQQSDSSVKQ